MAAIIAALMRPMSLAFVVLDPFSMDVLHFLPTHGLLGQAERPASQYSQDLYTIKWPGMCKHGLAKYS